MSTTDLDSPATSINRSEAALLGGRRTLLGLTKNHRAAGSRSGMSGTTQRRIQMSTDTTPRRPRHDQARVTAAEWFAGGERVPYDPESARVLTEEEATTTARALRVFERVAAAEQAADAVWLTLLPGYPDGSYGWAQVDRLLGEDLGPRLYVEPVGQGDSDKPRNYPYSTVERADVVEALWRHHGVRRTVVITFDYTAIALLELLRRQLEQTTSSDTARPAIVATLMVNGGFFADAHTHPWQSTPLLRTQLGALAMRSAQRSPRVFATSLLRARLYSRSYHPAPDELAELRSAIIRRDGAAFLHNAAGFVKEHRRHAQRWDLAAVARDLDGTVAVYVGGSEEDAYEHRQIPAARERVPQAEVLTFPGGHLTTSEHPDLLAAAIRSIATRHGVGAAIDDTTP
jgi:pimeloyl-ACP methyl ester carboxylesterase